MLAKRTSKNQITIPQKVIREFPDVEYFDVSKRENEIVLKPIQIQSDDSDFLKKLRAKMKALGISEDKIHDVMKVL